MQVARELRLVEGFFLRSVPESGHQRRIEPVPQRVPHRRVGREGPAHSQVQGKGAVG